MRRVALTLFCVLLAGFFAAAAAAQDSATPASGPRAEALRLIDDAADKCVRLAERIPADKYTWRPMEGVRSIAEVYLHLAAGNFSIPRRLGANPPEGLDTRNLERSTTDKAQIVKILKDSFDHVRKAVASLADADLEKTTQWLGGRQATYREIIFFLATHEHEHLGQSIAYARMNNVVPPWTEERQQQQQQPAKRP